MRLGHVALTAKDPAALAGFYERFLGLRKVGEAQTELSGAMVFLSTQPGGPPDLQVMSNPQGGHVAFKVDSLAELRELYAEAPRGGASVVMSLDHGPTLSFYVRDPEGNACEVYWETGRRSGGANRPIDLMKSEEELLQLIRA
ncbi:MAG TPA: VOC family protein [Candidatus Dormibacteraeota bacterium]|nr:VOC family protein [Candidatus Dormibacteraeota bacterium]